MVALCSPLNPTGTVFTKEQLEGICDLIIKENQRREGKQKPLYLLYDQIYWNLTYGDAKHYDPISLRPEMKPYTILIDGLSKAFAATGLRVGWAYGPSEVISKMKLLLAHVGSWSSRPVQAAVARYLNQEAPVDNYLSEIKSGLSERLNLFYKGFQDLKEKGYPVDAISPQAALYLTVKLDFSHFSTPEGDSLHTGREVYKYLLNEAGVALVPFYAFGLAEDSIWYRLSVGTAKLEEIPTIFKNIEQAFSKLKEKSSI